MIAGISIDKSSEARLKRIGVRDSKELSPGRRRKLARAIEGIAKNVVILKISACRIDKYRKEGVNLNKLEGMRFADIANHLNPVKAYIDSPDVNLAKFKKFLKNLVRVKTDLVVEHYADKKYPVVSAASIIAKVTRDSEIEKLRKKYGFRGTGYPSDERTVSWLEEWMKKKKKFPKCVRRTWVTAELLEKDREQSKLTKWLRRAFSLEKET